MQSIKNKYGFLPTSIWYFSSKNKHLELYTKDYIGHDTLYTTYVKKNGRKSTRSSRDGLSQFHPDLADRIIKIWSNENDVILDPFAGRTRALIAKLNNRFYIGYEISKFAYKYLLKKINSQKTFDETFQPTIKNKDSLSITEKNFYDFIFSCPPYWNLENYDKLYNEKIKGQLSSIASYEQFIYNLSKIIYKCYIALKKNKYAVFVVGDFRKNGIYYDFHNDMISICRKAGFNLHDIVINKIKTMVNMKVEQCISNKITVKEHEYVLVFKK